jgi:hypothetical protein
MSDRQHEPQPEKPKLARGGFIEPGDGDDYVRPDCGIKGYCPTHDGRLIAIRDGRFADVTEEAIEARLPKI